MAASESVNIVWSVYGLSTSTQFVTQVTDGKNQLMILIHRAEVLPSS
jgi:hypothetical protein